MQPFLQATIKAVQQYIEGEEYKYSFDEDSQRFELKFQSSCGVLQHSCTVYEEEDCPEECRIVTYCRFPINIEEDKRSEVAKLLIGLNYHFKIGSYEMDIEDGELLYKTQLYCYHGLVPPKELIEHYFDLPYLMMKRSAEGIMKMLFAQFSAEQALKLIVH